MRKNLGHRISQYRDKKGLSQVAFAKLLGVDKGTVWRWEDGRSWPDQLEPIAGVLGIEVEDLLEEVPRESPLEAAEKAITLAKKLGPALVARLSAMDETEISDLETALSDRPILNESRASASQSEDQSQHHSRKGRHK